MMVFKRALPVLSGACGLVLSFVSLGAFFAGLPLALQAITPVFFAAIGFFGERSYPHPFVVPLAASVGAFPLGFFLMQFRDKHDSHLLPVAISLSWFAAVYLGALVGWRLKVRC